MNGNAQQAQMTSDADFHRQIREGCLRRGWDEGELARRAGVSRTTLYYLRRGTTRRPRASTLSRIAHALDIDPRAFAGNDNAGVPAAEPPSHALASVATDLCNTGLPASDEQRGRQRRFDRRTNPLVERVRGTLPDLFVGWHETDWDELYSNFGTGGALTEEGVVEAATRMNHRRETVRRLQVVLETHLAEVAERMVETLFEMTRPQSNLAQTPQLEELLRDRLPAGSEDTSPVT